MTKHKFKGTIAVALCAALCGALALGATACDSEQTFSESSSSKTTTAFWGNGSIEALDTVEWDEFKTANPGVIDETITADYIVAQSTDFALSGDPKADADFTIYTVSYKMSEEDYTYSSSVVFHKDIDKSVTLRSSASPKAVAIYNDSLKGSMSYSLKGESKTEAISCTTNLAWNQEFTADFPKGSTERMIICFVPVRVENGLANTFSVVKIGNKTYQTIPLNTRG